MEADTEIEALRSIFGDEITVETILDRSITIVRKKVRPNDEEGVSSASILIEFELGTKYPEVSPKIRLTHPRGISEQSHHQLIQEINQMTSENAGLPIMFDVLQHCADFILEHQHSSSLLCPICLCPMMSKYVSATPCDHYAHSNCLDLHVEHTRKQLGEKLTAREFKMCDDIDKSLRCPVCRVVIEEEVDPILPSSFRESKRSSSPNERGNKSQDSPSQQESHFDFEFDWEKWRQQQASMLIIYEKQKEKGGIIDLEEERKKTLITEDTVVVLGNELDDLTTEPTFSAADAFRGNSNCSGIIDVDASIPDVSPRYVDALPTNLCTNTFRNEYYSSNRGRNRVTRFHGHKEGGQQRKVHRGGQRSAFVMKSALAVPDASVSKLESVNTLTDGSHYSCKTHRPDRHLASGARTRHQRGSSQYLVHWNESKDKTKSCVQVCDIQE